MRNRKELRPEATNVAKRPALIALAVLTAGSLSVACSPANEQASTQSSTEASAVAKSSASAASATPADGEKNNVGEVKNKGTEVPGYAAENIDGIMPITLDGELKPGNEIAVIAPCEGDQRATLTSSLNDEKVEMTPAADRGGLLGYLQVPDQIGPGPQDGYHTLTVTCASGEKATAKIPSSGNGGA